MSRYPAAEWPDVFHWNLAIPVDTPDPDGLEQRQRMLTEGWTFTPPPTCPTCGQRDYR